MVSTKVWVCEECEGPAAPCLFVMVQAADNEDVPEGCAMHIGSSASWKPQTAGNSGAGANNTQQTNGGASLNG